MVGVVVGDRLLPYLVVGVVDVSVGAVRSS